jgi:hypothetical protein
MFRLTIVAIIRDSVFIDVRSVQYASETAICTYYRSLTYSRLRWLAETCRSKENYCAVIGIVKTFIYIYLLLCLARFTLFTLRFFQLLVVCHERLSVTNKANSLNFLCALLNSIRAVGGNVKVNIMEGYCMNNVQRYDVTWLVCVRVGRGLKLYDSVVHGLRFCDSVMFVIRSFVIGGDVCGSGCSRLYVI